MDRHYRLHLLTLGALATLAALPAMAQDDPSYFPYYYFGIGAGQARARIDEQRITDALAASGLAATSISHDARPAAYKVFGGYQFNRHLGMELGYVHLGGFGFNAATAPAGALNGDFRVQGGNLDLVGTMPFTDRFAALARVGVLYARTRGELNGSGAAVPANARPSDRDTSLKVGLGLQYAVSPAFLLRGEVERLRVSDALGSHARVSMYSVSAVFPFGRTATTRRAAAQPYAQPYAQSSQAEAPAPLPSAPPPPPAAVVEAAPMAAVAAAPAAPRRVSYAAESFFAFDRSELQPAGQQALDAFVVQMRGASFDAITVQGYADRLGSVACNQTLSLARADAVKAYLVSTGGLDANKIKTAGRNESAPVTLPDDCKGPMSASVVACLQPDRRVELQVIGWR